MNANDRKELHTKTVQELRKLLKEAEAALLQLRLDHKQAKLKNVRSLFLKRREIAVLQTVMNEKAKEGKK
jgi:ribosomal protein L29